MTPFRLPLLLVGLAASFALAQPVPPGKASPLAPTVTGLSALGAKRGTSIDLAVTGTNLADASGVWASFPTKATVLAEGKSPTSIKVRLDIPADAPLGFHFVRVIAPKGVSNARLFCVDDLPQVASTNQREAKSAQPIQTPCVVTGRLDAEATDYYKLSLKPNQRVTLEILGRRLGSQLDPQITLFDSAGKELPDGHSNDAPGLQTDARLAYISKQGGELVLAVRDVSYRGGADYHYRLRIGDFPLASTPLPLAIKRGTKAQISFAGPLVGGVAPVMVEAPSDPAAEAIQVAPKGANGQHGWPVTLHLSDLDEQSEKEPNDEVKQANKLAIPGAVTGRLEKKGDVDHYLFTAKKGQRWVIEAHTVEHLSPTEVYMVLRDAKGVQLAATNPATNPKLDFTAAADGDYTLAVEHLHTWGGPDEVYRVTVTPYQPEFSLSLNLDRWEAMPGATLAVPIFATRTGYNGPIEVSAVGKGVSGTVTLAAGQAKPNTPAGTLTVKLADTLPPGVTTFAIQGKATIDGKAVTKLASVRGVVAASLGNLAIPPKEALSRLAVLALERPPFALAITADGLVTITNSPGFDGEVSLTVEGGAKLEVLAVRTTGATTTLRVALPPGKAVVGVAKHHGRDWTIRAAPAAPAKK